MAVLGALASPGFTIFPEIRDCRNARIKGTSNTERDSQIWMIRWIFGLKLDIKISQKMYLFEDYKIKIRSKLTTTKNNNHMEYSQTSYFLVQWVLQIRDSSFLEKNESNKGNLENPLFAISMMWRQIRGFYWLQPYKTAFFDYESPLIPPNCLDG